MARNLSHKTVQLLVAAYKDAFTETQFQSDGLKQTALKTISLYAFFVRENYPEWLLLFVEEMCGYNSPRVLTEFIERLYTGASLYDTGNQLFHNSYSCEEVEELGREYLVKLAHSIIKEYEEGRWLPEDKGVIDELKAQLEADEASDAETSTSPIEEDAETMTGPDKRKVFVVYGRNEKARKALFAFLRALGLDPKEWSQWVNATRQGSPYTGEVLKRGFQEAQAFVILMTPDDEAQLREPLRGKNEEPHEVNLTPQPRPNVIYEAGMAMGIAEERTILVELGKLRPISDIFGRHVVRIDNTPQKRKELAQRLESAGCPVDMHGNDWLDAGDFDAALEGL
jgi:predicted nucleotide-binding protein